MNQKTKTMTNKTVLITGASSGFGEATAKLLGKRGYNLILIARRETKLQKLAKNVNTQTFVRSVDVCNRISVDELFKELPNKYKQIDVLVNSAGLALGIAPAYDAMWEDWASMIETNVKGMAYVTYKCLPIMKARNKGLIINVSSVSAKAPYKGGNVYGATKAFVSQFSRNLRTDLLGTNIKVTNIEPGGAETEFSIVRYKGNKEKAKEVYKNTRSLKAGDIAEAISWVIERPEHVNIDNMEIMPMDQTWGGLANYKKEK